MTRIATINWLQANVFVLNANRTISTIRMLSGLCGLTEQGSDTSIAFRLDQSVDGWMMRGFRHQFSGPTAALNIRGSLCSQKLDQWHRHWLPDDRQTSTIQSSEGLDSELES